MPPWRQQEKKKTDQPIQQSQIKSKGLEFKCLMISRNYLKQVWAKAKTISEEFAKLRNLQSKKSYKQQIWYARGISKMEFRIVYYDRHVTQKYRPRKSPRVLFCFARKQFAKSHQYFLWIFSTRVVRHAEIVAIKVQSLSSSVSNKIRNYYV